MGLLESTRAPASLQVPAAASSSAGALAVTPLLGHLRSHVRKLQSKVRIRCAVQPALMLVESGGSRTGIQPSSASAELSAVPFCKTRTSEVQKQGVSWTPLPTGMFITNHPLPIPVLTYTVERPIPPSYRIFSVAPAHWPHVDPV